MKIQHHPGTPCNIKVQECYEKIPLIDEKWGFSFPEKLEIELTRKCNLNCIHCWNNSPKENEEIITIMCRYRTLGCSPSTGAVPSSACTLDEIIEEVIIAKNSERENRAIDNTSESSMEEKKKQGYF